MGTVKAQRGPGVLLQGQSRDCELGCDTSGQDTAVSLIVWGKPGLARARGTGCGGMEARRRGRDRDESQESARGKEKK